MMKVTHSGKRARWKNCRAFWRIQHIRQCASATPNRMEEMLGGWGEDATREHQKSSRIQPGLGGGTTLESRTP